MLTILFQSLIFIAFFNDFPVFQRLPEPLLKCVRFDSNIFLICLSEASCKIFRLSPDSNLQLVRGLPLPRDFHIASHGQTDSVRLDGPKIRLVNSRNAVEWNLLSGRVAKAKRFGSRPRDFGDFLDKLTFGFK
jgi:hypothetical protein